MNEDLDISAYGYGNGVVEISVDLPWMTFLLNITADQTKKLRRVLKVAEKVARGE